MIKISVILLLCMCLLFSCEQSKNPILDDEVIVENTQIEQKNDKVIEYHCCYDFENIQINGAGIFGNDINTLINTFENIEFESVFFGGSCGIRAFNDNQPVIVSGFSLDFLLIGLKDDIEKEKYFVSYMDVTSLLNNNFTLTLNGKKYDVDYQPTIFEVIEAWNLEVKNYKLDELVLQNDTKDYGLTFIFDEYNVLKKIDLWGPC